MEDPRDASWNDTPAVGTIYPRWPAAPNLQLLRLAGCPQRWGRALAGYEPGIGREWGQKARHGAGLGRGDYSLGKGEAA